MGGLLIAALGLGLLGWQLRGLDGRPGLHPRFLKTRSGSAGVWLIGIAGVLVGGRGMAAEFGLGGPVALGAVVGATLWALGSGMAHRVLVRELSAAVARQRSGYPALDEEALYRFAVAGRYPHLSSRQVEELTVDCGGIDDLARRLAAIESARRRESRN